MREMKVKQILVLLVVFGLVMFAEPILARTNRKQGGSAPRSASGSTHGSAPQFSLSNSGTRQSLSSRPIQPTLPRISARPGSTTGSSFFTSPGQATLRSHGINRKSSSIFNRSRELDQTSSRFNLNSSFNSSQVRKPQETQRPEEKIYGIPRRELRKEIPSTRPDQQNQREEKGQLPDLDISRSRKFREREDREKGDRHHYNDEWRYRDHYARRYYPGYPSRRIFYWITWPDYYRPICYDYGPYWDFGYYWPYYHRRYVFVSLGGWWPYYQYPRYYWYPCHLYTWYGYDPVAYVIPGETYNYYTYNYYYDGSGRLKPGEVINGVEEEKPPEKPAEETQADRYFEEGVKFFEKGDYTAAVTKFQDALKLAPDDVVLPFAYVQVLFSDSQYKKATEVLREALNKASPEKEGVFYPRGLYLDENVLQEQIEKLSRAVRLNSSDLDLQLLLGYQLLGIGRFDEVVEHLEKAQEDGKNKQAATLLMNLQEKLKNAKENNS